jgi:O-antigen ligase
LGVGSILSFAVIVLVTFAVSGRRQWWLITASMAAAVSLVALMFPVGGRGPIIATVAALLAGLVLLPLRQPGSFRVSGRGKAVVLVGVVATIAVVLRILESGDYALAAERFLVLLEPGMGDSAGVRWYYYISSLGIIADRPWFGVGAGGWPVAMGMGTIRDYPHNLILEVLAEQGLVGGALLAALLGYTGWLVFRRDGALSTQSGLTVVLLVVSAFVSAMVSGDISDNRVLFCMLGLCAVAPARATVRWRLAC